MFEDTSKSRLDKIEHQLLEEKKVSLWLKRDDLLHPQISGNKWRKLKYNFVEARERGIFRILTFGGAYSNHLLSTAAAAKAYGFEAIGVVRGDELNYNSNPTLRACHDLGMRMIFVSRTDYRLRNDPAYQQQLIKDLGSLFIVPEGGSNPNAVLGVKEVIGELELGFDYVAAAVGTGGTIAGLTTGLGKYQRALGISVLKQAHYLDDDVRQLISEVDESCIDRFQINHDFHLGGYAKFTVGLIEFINEFKTQSGIQFDPIYTGKLMFALFQLVEQSYFGEGSKIVAMHTGGLQGISGFNAKHGDLIETD